MTNPFQAEHTAQLMPVPGMTNRYWPACTCGWQRQQYTPICKAQPTADRHADKANAKAARQ